MANAEIINALRCCASLDTSCKGLCSYHGVEYCLSKKDLDAAAALKAAEKRIAEQQKQIAQLYMLLNNRINEIAELEAQMPKEGEWIGEGDGYADGEMVYDMWSCSECGEYFDEWDDRPTWNYCPNCGAKMKGEQK